MADRLRGIVVSPRADLETTRHVFQGEPTYVVRDPISFQSHAMEVGDYAMFVALGGEDTLGDKFEQLVEADVLESGDEEQFYDFILGLHRLGLLSLPVSDDKVLYERFEKRRAAERRGKVVGFLFLRIPLWNPDQFLIKTVRYVRPLFSLPAFLLWIVAVCAAGVVVVARWSDLTGPVLTVFDTGTLPLLWFLLIGLKLIHEFGHAYACRVFGGAVPEMGAFMIMFTPCAYVDASASWGFTQRRHRLIVDFAGMYFESITAIVALFVWASTSPSLLNTAAYQTLLLSSVATIGFNINPLARFDGYYVLSDLMNMPNLRARARQQLQSVTKRLVLGMPEAVLPYSRRMRSGLLAYGIGSAFYRISIVLGIAAVVATKSLLAGIVIGGSFIGMLVVGSAVKAAKYLLFSEDTAQVRRRAIVVAVLLFVVLPVSVGGVPIHPPVEARGAVHREQYEVLRARVPGFLVAAPVADGAPVRPGETVARLENLVISEAAQYSTAELQLSALRVQVDEESNPAAARQAQIRLEYARERADHARQLDAQLAIESTMVGRLLTADLEQQIGRYFDRGEVVAEVGAGAWVVTLMVPGEVLADVTMAVGDEIDCMPIGRPGAVVSGVIERIAPAGTHQVVHEALAETGGGSIPVDARSGTTARAYFEIRVRVDSSHPEWMHGATVELRLDTRPRTLASRLVRRLHRFFNLLRAE